MKILIWSGFFPKQSWQAAKMAAKIMIPYLQDIIAHNINSPAVLGRFRARKNNFWQGPREAGKFPGRVCAKPE